MLAEQVPETLHAARQQALHLALQIRRLQDCWALSLEMSWISLEKAAVLHRYVSAPISVSENSNVCELEYQLVGILEGNPCANQPFW